MIIQCDICENKARERCSVCRGVYCKECFIELEDKCNYCGEKVKCRYLLDEELEEKQRLKREEQRKQLNLIPFNKLYLREPSHNLAIGKWHGKYVVKGILNISDNGEYRIGKFFTKSVLNFIKICGLRIVMENYTQEGD